MLNKVILIGRVGNEPDVKYLNSGVCCSRISVATSKKYKDKSTGEKKEDTQWHKVVFFNKTAQVIEKYVGKGDLLYIEGEIKTRTYEQDGITKYITEINGYNMQMLNSNNKKNDYNSNSESKHNQENEFNDDVPF